ncbi:DEAD/DEAH box helicase [Ostertagia ostertagi]
MDLNFRFSNLIGSVYRNGDVIFSPDGNSVISPVGNKISIFDLKNNVSRTLCFDCMHNIMAVAMNSTGSHMIVSNEGGHVLYINMSTETVIFQIRANRTVRSVQFSPDGKFIAICRDMDLQIQEIGKQSTSILIVAGGEDHIVRVVGARYYRNLFIHPLAAHQGPIVTCQFINGNYDRVTIIINEFTGKWTKPEENEMESEDESVTRLYYEKTKRYSLLESSGSGKSGIDVTSCRIHTTTNILVTAYSNGVFVLHEVPSFALIHNLRVSDMQITSVAVNNTGDWLALGCGKGSAAQLVVWEWQSETYVLKQQAHSQRILAVQYSPDGSLLGTGAEDGKVKIWNGHTAFCTVTFDEHTSAVTGICWTQSGKAILSASLDGTVRAHDLKRYRNFRTLVCPEPTQLGSLAVDQVKSDLLIPKVMQIRATIQIFVWSMENGSLLDVLSGHQSNIASISMHGNALASVSWDRTLKLWNIVDSTCETTELAQEGLAVAFSPCGTIGSRAYSVDSNVTIYHAKDVSYLGLIYNSKRNSSKPLFLLIVKMAFIGSIDARLDLDPSRGQADLITSRMLLRASDFSPDSALLLLGGESNNFCMYSVVDRMLVKKFTITENRSLDGVVLDVNRRNFTEFGNMALFDSSDSETEPDGKRAIRLPGSKHFDLGERSARPQVAVYAVTYCPTGRRFAVCSTEGVGVYSLDTVGLFDPFQLDSQTTPAMIKNCTLIAFILREKLLKWIADGRVVASSTHVHFYMIWLRHILNIHGMRLKGRTDVAILTGIQQIVAHHTQLNSKLADQNKFGLRYILAARKLRRKNEAQSMEYDSKEILKSPWDELYLPQPIMWAIRELGKRVYLSASIFRIGADWCGLIVDETDRMVEKGHFEEMQDILKFVRHLIVAGGEDHIVRVVGARYYRNLFIHPLAAHQGPIVTCQFINGNYDLISVCKRGIANVWTASIQPGDLVEGKWTKPEENEMESEDESVTRLYYEKTKRVSDMQITSVAVNNTGDWLALGCGKGSAAQLVVWEWQSETYVLKQQAHSQRILAVQYSPDGSLLGTGAEDGKVKIWNGHTAFCTVTFDEHTSAVTGICWTQSGKAILSASLDGTVRAHDLKRYRNFRTLVCPEPTQLGSLAVDQSGDIVVAGAKEVFSVRSKLELWNIVDSTCETTELAQEGLAVAFSPCGLLVAVLTVDSNVTIYHAKDMAFIGSIDARLDLDPSRGQADLITRQNAAKSKCVYHSPAMQFSPDSALLLLGGESNNFCMYSVVDRMLVKKFTITENRSLDGVVLDVNRRNFTEFGNMALFDSSDSETEPDGKRAIRLPGSKHFDLGERSARPQVAVYAVTYCPTGRRFAVCSTEGVGVYSLDTVGLFDPFQLDSQTTPAMIKNALSLDDYSTALMASLRLNDTPLIQRSMESTPLEQIELVVRSLPLSYVEKLLKWIADGRVVASSTHVHFYMIWLRHILNIHGMRLKGRTDVAILTGIQQIVAHHTQLISKLADQNKFGLRYILAARKLRRKNEAQKILPEDIQSPTKGKKKKKIKAQHEKKKKKRKRETEKAEGPTSPKKVKFALEGPAQASQAPTKAEDPLLFSQQEEEYVQRIVIDDEEESTDELDDSKETLKSPWDELYLPQPIMWAIRELGFKTPTEIQKQVLPLAVRDHCDVLGAAETGSGKTLAYAIPMATRLLELPLEAHSKKTGPKALILAPTRELVVQAFSIVGGLAQVRQARILREQKPPKGNCRQLLGRLWAMMKEMEEGVPVCQYLSDWSGLVCLIVDETDRMVEKGHFEEMQDILKFVKQSATDKLQTLVFSATLTYVHHDQSRVGPYEEGADATAKNKLEASVKLIFKELIQLTGMRPNCKVVDITREFGTAEALVGNKDQLLKPPRKRHDDSLSLGAYKYRCDFTNSVDASRRMYGILRLLKLQPLMIHAKMEQKVRLRNLEKFAGDSRSVLLATDVAARGLDIQGIDNVIHYQVPKTAEMYIHRSGRTARASRKGLSVLIVDSKDAHLYRRLCKNLNREKDLPVFPVDCPELMKRLTTRVKLASALDTFAHRSKKIRLSENWFDKIIREADLAMDDLRWELNHQ